MIADLMDSISSVQEPLDSRIHTVSIMLLTSPSEQHRYVEWHGYPRYMHTVFYGYRSSATTTITVQPLSTTLAKPEKTPEELEEEAEQAGWLSIEHEFTWWYPWYRLHLNMTGADPPIDLIVTPLALDVTIGIYDESVFASHLQDAFDIGYDIAWGIIIGHIATEIAARVSGRISWPAFFVALAINVGAQLALAAAANAAWKDARTWFISFFASLLAAAGEALMRVLQGTMMKWLTGIARTICGRVTNTFKSWFAMGLNFALLTEIAFIFVDVVLAVTFYYWYSTGWVI